MKKTPTKYIHSFIVVIAMIALVFISAPAFAQAPGGPFTPIQVGSQPAIYPQPAGNAIYNPSTPLVTAVSPASTACTSNIQKFADLMNFATCIMNRFLLTIAISFAAVYFVWGVVQYVLAPASAEERKKSKQVMLWGILSLFVIVSVWGIVAAMRQLFGI